MKLTLVFTFILTLLSSHLFAQSESQSLAELYEFGWPTYTGGYFAPVVKQSKFLDETGYMAGARAGVTFNESFLIGASGYKLMSDDIVYYDAQRDLNRDFSMSYGGVFVGWNFFPRSIVNLTLFTNYSWGALKLAKPSESEDAVLANKSAYDSIQVVEPELMVDVNITRYFRAGVGYGYRWVRGRDFKEITKDDADAGVGIFAVSLRENIETRRASRF